MTTTIILGAAIIAAIIAGGVSAIVAQRRHIDELQRQLAQARAQRDEAQRELTRLTDRDARGRFVRREPKP
jgi:outer membrane protein TolC